MNIAGEGPHAVAFHYDRTTILLHWLTAALIVVTWVMGFGVDLFPKPLKIDARSAHFVLGISLGVVLAVRLLRQRKMSRPPALTSAAAERGRRFGHAFLYAFLGLQVILGLLNAWGRGDSVFNLFTVPRLAATNPAVRNFLEDAHWWSAYLFLVVVGVHAAIALFHHYLLRDGVLRRMTGRRHAGRPSGDVAIADANHRRLEWGWGAGAFGALVLLLLGWQTGWFGGGSATATTAAPPVWVSAPKVAPAPPAAKSPATPAVPAAPTDVRPATPPR